MPNRRCCCCTIARDDFNRADALDLGGDWDLRGGAWVIAANVASSGSANALAIFDLDHPDDPVDSHVVSCKVEGTDDGDQLRVVCNWSDDDNYLFAELEVYDLVGSAACGSLSLFERVGGANTLLTKTNINPLETNKSHTLRICYDGDGIVRASVTTEDGATAAIRAEATPAAGGLRAGIGTGSITTLANFDGWSWKKHGEDTEGCPKCEVNTCVIYSDDFDRADSTDVGCEWTEIDGDWEIASNRLVPEGADNLIRCEVAHNDDPTYAKVVVTAKGDAGDLVRLIVDYDDDDNYHFVELKVANEFGANGTIELFQRVAGVETSLDGPTATTTVSEGFDFTITICFADDTLMADVDGVTAVSQSGLTHLGGDLAAIATGATAADVSFDEFGYLRLRSEDNPDCEPCLERTCSSICENNVVPALWKVKIAGLVDGTCGCSADNGTYITETGTFVANDYCRTSTVLTGTACDNWEIRLSVSTFFDLLIFMANGAQTTQYQFTPPAELDCLAVTDMDLPFLNANPHQTLCDVSASTVTLTAI